MPILRSRRMLELGVLEKFDQCLNGTQIRNEAYLFWRKSLVDLLVISSESACTQSLRTHILKAQMSPVIRASDRLLYWCKRSLVCRRGRCCPFGSIEYNSCATSLVGGRTVKGEVQLFCLHGIDLRRAGLHVDQKGIVPGRLIGLG